MPIAHAMWTHGHSLKVQYPDRASVTYFGSTIRVIGNADTRNWLLAAVPTPVYVENIRLFIDSVLIRYRVQLGAAITTVNVWDGDTVIASFEGRRYESRVYSLERFVLTHVPNIFWGVGISIGVDFGAARESRRIEISSAGADFLASRTG